jgi:hypothetical protein
MEFWDGLLRIRCQVTGSCWYLRKGHLWLPDSVLSGLLISATDNSQIRKCGFGGRGQVTGVIFIIFKKDVREFLIAFNSNFVDSMHGFFTNVRNVLEIAVF